MKEAWGKATNQQILCSLLLFVVVMVMLAINGIWRLKNEQYLQEQQQILRNSSVSDRQWQLEQLQSRTDITDMIMILCLSVTTTLLYALLLVMIKDVISNHRKSRPKTFPRSHQIPS